MEFFSTVFQNGVWIKDPIKTFKIEEVERNINFFISKEHMYADAYVKGIITKEQFKRILK